MNAQTVLAILALVAMHLVPGYLLLRAFGFPRQWSLCLAPLPSVGLICLMGQLYASLGMPATPLMMFAPLVVVLGALALLLGKRMGQADLPSFSWWIPLLYVGIGLSLTYLLFLGRLVYPEQIMQAFDTTQAVGLIRSFANSQRYSSIGVGYYLEDPSIDPFPGLLFYPSSWHMLCALAVNVTGIGVPIVVNAIQTVSVGIVFPLSVAALMAILFKGDQRLMVAGSLCCLAFVYFPWVFIMFGPIYPNTAAFATLPCCIALFIAMTSDGLEMRHRIGLGIAFLVASAGLALLHPNAVFSAAVFLGPYCAWRIASVVRAKRGGIVAPLASALCFCLLFAGIWYGCFKIPFFRPIVWESWGTFTKEWQEFVNIVCLSYTYGHWYEFATQYPLAIAVIIGAVSALHDPDRRWLVVSYGLACFIMLVCATQDSDFKHLVAGFWYCDHLRVAGMCAICAIPLAALGLEWLFEQVMRIVRLYNGSHAQSHLLKVAVICSVLFLFVNFMPEFDMPGSYFDKVLNEGLNDDVDPEVFETYTEARRRLVGRKYHSVHTTFGDYRSAFVKKTISENPICEEERQFLIDVAEIVGPDDLVINDPMDGSFLAYGFDNIRVYYRTFAHRGWDEMPESEIIRTDLVNITTNPAVREAVDKIGAKYVLVLSHTRSEESYINLRGNYSPTFYEGISTISPDNPGFEVVLQSRAFEDDIYLYRILPAE